MDILDTLYVVTPGTSLRLEGDTVRIRHPDQPGRRIVPLLRVESIVVWHGVDIGPDLLHRCATLGIHVTWITQTGRLLASITGHEPGRPDLRLAQYRAYDNPQYRLTLATSMVAGKIQTIVSSFCGPPETRTATGNTSCAASPRPTPKP